MYSAWHSRFGRSLSVLPCDVAMSVCSEPKRRLIVFRPALKCLRANGLRISRRTGLAPGPCDKSRWQTRSNLIKSRDQSGRLHALVIRASLLRRYVLWPSLFTLHTAFLLSRQLPCASLRLPRAILVRLHVLAVLGIAVISARRTTLTDSDVVNT